jgi:hypothetical protein
VDALRQAFVDRTLEVSLHAANKAAACAAFAKVTQYKLPGADAKARKANADIRKATATPATNARVPPTAKHGDTTRPPPTK